MILELCAPDGYSKCEQHENSSYLTWEIEKNRRNCIIIDVYFPDSEEFKSISKNQVCIHLKKERIYSREIDNTGIFQHTRRSKCQSILLPIGKMLYTEGADWFDDKLPTDKYFQCIIKLDICFIHIQIDCAVNVPFDFFYPFFNSLNLNVDAFLNKKKQLLDEFHNNAQHSSKVSLKTKTAKTFDVIFGGKEKSKKSSTKKLSRQAEKILSAMEEMAKNPLITLPTLNHGYFYNAGSRITLYGDKKRWAVVFEKSGFQNRGGGVQIEITYLSNSLLYTNVNELNNDSLDNVKTIKIVEDRELFSILEDNLIISPKTKYITVRGQRLPVTRDKEEYRRCQINLEDPNILEIYNLIRLYDKKYPQIFRATEAEQRNCLPVDLPLIMSINQWHQPDWDFFDLPDFQSCETFRQIATVLSSLDSNCWQPSEVPNNNWQNWPDAGTL